MYILTKNIEILYDDCYLCVSITKKQNSDSVILVFASADLDFHGMDVYKPEFFKSSNLSTTIFIFDKTISFGNNVDFNLLHDIIKPHIKDKKVYSLGSSMGAYNAIISSNFIDIDTIVAFVPMFSPSPEIIHKESRWLKYINNVKIIKFKSLEYQFNDKTNYYIIAGFVHLDEKHLLKMPSKPNIHKIYFKHHLFHHDVARILQSEKKLYDLIKSCYNGKHPKQIINEHLSVGWYQAFWPDENNV